MMDDIHKEAYWEGYSAYQYGLGRYDNPYDQDAQATLYDAWLDGYHSAWWDD